MSEDVYMQFVHTKEVNHFCMVSNLQNFFFFFFFLIVKIFILSLQLMDLFRWTDSSVACMGDPYSLEVFFFNNIFLLFTILYRGFWLAFHNQFEISCVSNIIQIIYFSTYQSVPINV